MTLTQIQYFIAAAEQGSFSLAAANNFVSQPAVSKQVSLLENELGFQLFRRDGRRVYLTAAGELFRDLVLRCQNDMQDTIAIARSLNLSSLKTITIGSLEYWNTSAFFRPVCREFAKRHGDVQLNLKPYLLEDLLRALRSGEVDLVICGGEAPEEREGFTAENLGFLECGLMYSKDDFPGIDCSHASETGLPASFKGVPVLYVNDSFNPFLPLMPRVFKERGLDFPRVACQRYTAMMALASCGNGVVFASRWHYLYENLSFGFYPLGKALPVFAAWQSASLTADKAALIRDILNTVQRCI